MNLSLSLFFFSSVLLCYCQDIITALSAYTDLLQYRDLINEHPNYLARLSNLSTPVTVLVSTNEAFVGYETSTAHSVHSLAPSVIDNLLLYQTWNETADTDDYDTPGGYLAGTWLTSDRYNLRPASSSGKRPGQVCYISPPSKSITRRQGLSTNFVTSGLGTQIALEPITGNWSGGTFQAVNGYVWTLVVKSQVVKDGFQQ